MEEKSEMESAQPAQLSQPSQPIQLSRDATRIIASMCLLALARKPAQPKCSEAPKQVTKGEPK